MRRPRVYPKQIWRPLDRLPAQNVVTHNSLTRDSERPSSFLWFLVRPDLPTDIMECR